MSDKQKHSEGPWAAACDEARGNPRCLIVDKNGHEVASVNPYCENWNENASLIMDAWGFSLGRCRCNLLK
jgi:hypothetical protein